MLAHALLSLLVFNHGVMQIRFGLFELFCFCFMSNKYNLMLLNFGRYLVSVNTIFFINEKSTQWSLNTKVKRFHESISCFMKCPWNCISLNAPKEMFTVFLCLNNFSTTCLMARIHCEAFLSEYFMKHSFKGISWNMKYFHEMLLL